ncbi:hypothetical protein [Leeuwenhoekiella sp. MAR_2009_132]|uniref:hypothetical protein n=1 Tax=Leeuwenhoekiella sp. MAR_2009_132 TaxID=1392489 RepID=UPI00048BCFE4|nr:hypothetical protein [Leeuwenhoekiella sp. MAR_2009_132]
MIIVNLYCDEDYNPETDGFHLHLAGVVNDTVDLYHDPQLIQECIENDPDFEPKAGQFYEVQLIRGTIASDPVPEPAFAIDRVIEKKRSSETGDWETPLVRM